MLGHPDYNNDELRSDTELQNVNSQTNMQLLEEIEALLATPMVEEMDTDKILENLKILQERAPVMVGYDAAAHQEKMIVEHPEIFSEVSSEEHKKRGKSAPRRRDVSGRNHRRAGLISRGIQIAVAAMLLLVVSANAFGINPVQAFFKWADGVVQVFSNPSGLMELPADDPSEYHTLEEALEADGIDSKGCPNWVPRDYELKLITVRPAGDIKKYSAFYRGARGEILIRVVEFVDAFAINDERDDDGYIYASNGHEYYIATNLEQPKAGWQRGKYYYTVSGEVSETELKEIIDSIE